MRSSKSHMNKLFKSKNLKLKLRRRRKKNRILQRNLGKEERGAKRLKKEREVGKKQIDNYIFILEKDLPPFKHLCVCL